MTVKFYYNESDPVVVDKTITQYGTTTTDFYYKDNTELINPVFKVKTLRHNIDKINYCYVDELKRYYYIENIEYKQGYIELHCKVDVLMSFKKEIDQQACIVIRSENNYNFYISDDKIRTEAQLRVVTLDFENGFDVSGNKVANFVLTLNGGGATGS